MTQLHEIEITQADITDTARWAYESGIQPWSFDPAAAARLRKYNELQSAQHPNDGRFAGLRGFYVPAYAVPLDSAGNLLSADLDRLLAWLQGHHDTGKVNRVRLHAPRTGQNAEFPIAFLLGALTAARYARTSTGAFIN